MSPYLRVYLIHCLIGTWFDDPGSQGSPVTHHERIRIFFKNVGDIIIKARQREKGNYLRYISY
jgi:hypothetical protein